MYDLIHFPVIKRSNLLFLIQLCIILIFSSIDRIPQRNQYSTAGSFSTYSNYWQMKLCKVNLLPIKKVSQYWVTGADCWPANSAHIYSQPIRVL